MSKIKNFFAKRGPVAVTLGVIASVLFVVVAVEAATTISTNISTGGTLDVTGVSTFTGDAVFDTTTMVVDVSADGVGFGTTTPSDLAHVENSSATSTIVISSGSASSGGRIILEDTDGAGCSEISILNGTIISETVACPTGI